MSIVSVTAAPGRAGRTRPGRPGSSHPRALAPDSAGSAQPATPEGRHQPAGPPAAASRSTGARGDHISGRRLIVPEAAEVAADRQNSGFGGGPDAAGGRPEPWGARQRRGNSSWQDLPASCADAVMLNLAIRGGKT